ncbi:Spo0E family sporulation regulatory protein-aspartic acid phosphatase [Brevibacillus sp. NPDC003359]|uniref:Spo0E family sporulation regulatory protein-aspartic acid phosphatase n=1 Tax=unclassified Brevibacillus TaxID=2684853 RepID=UPI0036AD16EA
MNLIELSREIERMRCQLNQLSIIKSLTDPSVVQLSQELDELIVTYQNATKTRIQ